MIRITDGEFQPPTKPNFVQSSLSNAPESELKAAFEAICWRNEQDLFMGRSTP
jgi:hypothetical protein